MSMVRGRGRLVVAIGWDGLLTDRGFILGQSLREAVELGGKALDEPLLAFEQIEDLLGREPPCLKFLLRFARIHAVGFTEVPSPAKTCPLEWTRTWASPRRFPHPSTPV